ncbi:hypothetical protein AK812_SmicGene20707 [Symbiodinium microadriaticum]|uniref:Uncharacterized protein n=1 Tax=Symbiodinium microadriaticum TaxID=2951 RepID=A0A1Q9DPA5_SYMMI|nr:hypothetical protein AK812_SmicGene20707 [Symbiodinium microadriaticum]
MGHGRLFVAGEQMVDAFQAAGLRGISRASGGISDMTGARRWLTGIGGVFIHPSRRRGVKDAFRARDPIELEKQGSHIEYADWTKGGSDACWGLHWPRNDNVSHKATDKVNTSITGPNDDKVSEEDLDYSIIRYARKVEQAAIWARKVVGLPLHNNDCISIYEVAVIIFMKEIAVRTGSFERGTINIQAQDGGSAWNLGNAPYNKDKIFRLLKVRLSISTQIRDEEAVEERIRFSAQMRGYCITDSFGEVRERSTSKVFGKTKGTDRSSQVKSQNV